MSESRPALPIQLKDSEKARWHLLLYFVSFVGGMILCFHPTIFSGLNSVQTDTGDPVLNHYFLEHSWRWVADPSYPAAFWTPRFFHSTQYTLTYSENLVGTAPIYWGFRAFLDPLYSWQAWVLIVAALNYVAMIIVLRWFSINHFLVLAGAFVFAFGLPRQAQLNHHHLYPQVFSPFAAWYFWQFLQLPDRRKWLLFLVFAGWQLFASIHLGWFLMFGLMVWGFFIAALDRSRIVDVARFAWKRPLFMVMSSSVWLLLLGAFFRNYFIGNADVRREYQECLEFMPWIGNWLACPAGSIWSLHLCSGDYHSHEGHLSSGLVFYAIVIGTFIAACWHCREVVESQILRLAVSTFAASVSLVILTLHLGGSTSAWYGVYHLIPGANSIRAIGRVCFVVILLGLLGGLPALQYFVERSLSGRRSRNAVYISIMLLLTFEQICVRHDSFDSQDFYPSVRQFSTHLSGADAAYIVYDPAAGPHDRHDIYAMWAGMHANVPVVNGYSGREAGGYNKIDQNEPLPAVLNLLGNDWHGRILIITRDQPPDMQYFNVIPGSIPSQRTTAVAP